MKQLALAGCTKIAITDINQDTLLQCESAVRQHPGCDQRQLKIDLTVGDISDEAFVKHFVEKVITTFGRIDYAVNCAGILGPSLKAHETPTALFDKINNVNYKGSWLVNRELLSLMRTQTPLEQHSLQRGAIVNIASQLGIVGRSEAGKPRTRELLTP